MKNRAKRFPAGSGQATAALTPGTTRRIFSYARPYRLKLTLFLLITGTDACLSVANPILFKEIIDRGILRHDQKTVIVLASVLVLLALADAGLGLGQILYASQIGEGVVRDLRNQVYRHMQRQSVSFFVNSQTGSLVSRLNSDVIGAQQALTGILASIVQNLVILVGIFGVMAYLSWPTALVAAALIPLFVIPVKWIGRKVQRTTRESMQLDAEMGARMTERFSAAGATHVTLYGSGEREVDAFSQITGRVRDVDIKSAMYGRAVFIVLTLVASVGTAAIFGFGGSLVIRGDIQIGTLVALIILIGRMYAPITGLSNMQLQIMTALVSFDRVFEVLDFQPKISQSADAIPLARTEDRSAPGITFDEVSFTYPASQDACLASLALAPRPDAADRVETAALSGVSFQLMAGTTTGLVGPSGSGKSTVGNLIARLYDVTSGVIRIGEQDIRDVTLESLRNAIGIVTQDSWLFHDTIRGNLEYARPGACEAELLEACEAARISELIRSLPDGLDTIVGDRGYLLSGGERQRLAIARLLLKAPPIVVLDEATAHLDVDSETAVQEAMEVALAGRTSLVIAHRLSTVRRADQILVFSGGVIAERGAHEELLDAAGLYARLWQAPLAALGS